MDPASIVGLVAACSSLTKQCASVVKSLHGLIETYKSAELIILSVATECETIQFAWDRIETWAQQQLHHIDDFEDVGARLQKSIYCGELVMSALEEELVAIISKSSTPGRGISLTWNNSVLNEHQHRIRGQVAALQLLLQVLNLYDMASSEYFTANLSQTSQRRSHRSAVDKSERLLRIRRKCTKHCSVRSIHPLLARR